MTQTSFEEEEGGEMETVVTFLLMPTLANRPRVMVGELFRHDKEGSTLVRKGRREGGGAAAHCLGGRAGGGLTISVEPNEQEENWRRASRVSRSTRGVSGGAVGGLVRRKGRVWRAGLGLGRGSRRGGTTHESCDGGGSELAVDEEGQKVGTK